jgi:hypothetical protein
MVINLALIAAFSMTVVDNIWCRQLWWKYMLQQAALQFSRTESFGEQFSENRFVIFMIVVEDYSSLSLIAGAHGLCFLIEAVLSNRWLWRLLCKSSALVALRQARRRVLDVMRHVRRLDDIV